MNRTKNLLLILLLANFLIIGQTNAQKNIQKMRLPLSKGEKIWSGLINEGDKMPFSAPYHFNFYANNQGNQIQPLLLSNYGLWVWSEEPFEFEITDKEIVISDPYNAVKSGRNGRTLSDARNYVAKTFFPASGKTPDTLLFSRPQYNTWIELTYNQNQADVLKYAHAIVDNGFPTGVFMIDDTWQEDYGKWKFHPGRFPNPKAMIDELHQLGFKVMVWVCPFVSADQYQICHELLGKKAFLMEKKSESINWNNAEDPAMIKWWNGISAELDFTNDEAVKWFNNQLQWLVDNNGVDGFKFDAGDSYFYPENALSKEKVTPNKQTELFAQFGLKFPLNEYRACWKMGGQPLAQRLCDKSHNWEDLRKLIPNMIAEGLAGYTFSCPDMIGGGEFSSFLKIENIDQDLIVRSAQCHALMTMMQFSVAPWRILDKTHLDAVKKAVSLREKYTPMIMKLVKESAKTGEPVVGSLEYYFPTQGFELVKDEFMLGKKILIAPMLEKSKLSRNVLLPMGKWKADDGKIYEGGKTYSIDVPLERIPVFEFVDK